MIRQGRQQGWLKLPLDTLSTWSTLNGVQYNGVDVTIIPGKEERGSALRAIETLEQERNPLIIVPKDLIISKENVLLHAKSDRHLREVLEVAGEFSQVSLTSLCQRITMLTWIADSSWCYFDIHASASNT